MCAIHEHEQKTKIENDSQSQFAAIPVLRLLPIPTKLALLCTLGSLLKLGSFCKLNFLSSFATLHFCGPSYTPLVSIAFMRNWLCFVISPIPPSRSETDKTMT